MKKIILIVVTTLMCHATFSLASKPDHCPDWEKLQQSTIDKFEHRGTHWIAFFTYTTELPWVVGIDLPDVKNAAEAKEKAAKALASISFDQGPGEFLPGIWSCDYKTNAGVAVAIAPCKEKKGGAICDGVIENKFN